MRLNPQIRKYLQDYSEVCPFYCEQQGERLKLREGTLKNSKDFGDRFVHLVTAFHSLDNFAKPWDNEKKCTIGFSAALSASDRKSLIHWHGINFMQFMGRNLYKKIPYLKNVKRLKDVKGDKLSSCGSLCQ